MSLVEGRSGSPHGGESNARGSAVQDSLGGGLDERLSTSLASSFSNPASAFSPRQSSPAKTVKLSVSVVPGTVFPVVLGSAVTVHSVMS